jgi:hypothetical protein
MIQTAEKKLLSIIALEGHGDGESVPAPFYAKGEGNPPGDGSDSPLWMVTQEPLLNEMVLDLKRLAGKVIQDPGFRCELRFSKAYLTEVNEAFHHMILRGEERLHQLSGLICEDLLSSFQMESVVIGEVESTGERFTLTQNLSEDDLYATTDIDLGNRQLGKLQFYDGKAWSRASLVANVVEYQPTEPNRYHIHRVISRIKAEEELWNKVVDEIFDLDRLVHRDKKLRHLSRYVKDIFGLKIVVGDAADAYDVQRRLEACAWPAEKLLRIGIEPGEASCQLDVIEVKDYLQQDQRKQSGWAAVKSVVYWCDKTFEIQIQPLRNFLRERERLTKESHTSFKSRRERVRDEVAGKFPVFGFYRDLLRWLFLRSEGVPPAYPGITVVLVD